VFQDGSPGPQPNEPQTEKRISLPSQTRPRVLKPAPPTAAWGQPSGSWRGDFAPVCSRIGRGLLRHRSTTVGAPQQVRRGPSIERPSRTPARPRGFFSFGRFRVLFDSLFRVLFNFPSRYLFAVGLAVSVEPRMGRSTRLRAAFSNDPTLEPTRRFTRTRLARDAGPTPSLGRIRSGRVTRARHSSYFVAAGPCATCRRPPSRAAGFSARLCSLFHDRRFASLAVTEKTPVGFFFHRLVICLNSAGSPARPQVSSSLSRFHSRAPTLELPHVHLLGSRTRDVGCFHRYQIGSCRGIGAAGPHLLASADPKRLCRGIGAAEPLFTACTLHIYIFAVETLRRTRPRDFRKAEP